MFAIHTRNPDASDEKAHDSVVTNILVSQADTIHSVIEQTPDATVTREHFLRDHVCVNFNGRV